MSEWPRYVYFEDTVERPDDLADVEDAEPVIPADLGRELYEALHRLAYRSKHPDTEPQFVDHGCYDVLARYEREVGE